MDINLLIIRIAIGGVVTLHGTQKLFGWFGGHGLAGTGAFLETIGFRPGRAHALLLGAAELVGGIAFAWGFLTPLSSAVIAGVMLAAITVQWNSGYFAEDGGYEYPLVLAIVATAVAFTGAGRYSVDSAWDWSLGDIGWGIAAASVAVASAGAITALRRIEVRRHRRHRRHASAA